MSTRLASAAASGACVTVAPEPTPVGRKGREMSGKRVSAAAVKRLMKAEAERLAALEVAHAELDEEREAFLTCFVPRKMSRERWEEHAPFLRDLMRRSNVRGQATFGQLMSELSLYADWALDAGVEMSIEGLLRHDLVERWIAERGDGRSPTWGNRRSRLRNLASHVNPGPAAPRRATPFSRAAVRAPYSLRELADLERLALNQPSAASRRNLCTMLALGAGAGLSSSDLRGVTRAHVAQDAEGHWWVDVPGERPRRVPVRTSYAGLLEAAVNGLEPTDLLLGTKADRKNITGSAVANAAIGATNPMPEQSRLRASWLLAVITAPVPLADVMAAYGTASARSIVELLPYSTNPGYVARNQEVRYVHPQ